MKPEEKHLELEKLPTESNLHQAPVMITVRITTGRALTRHAASRAVSPEIC